ncbi:MAG: molybdopterin-dependent oxidoreductase [Dehalococcoidaceae bacterium]|nr:molybdopterin-dependent oxidoreductase [Dehalococcoidaceae bacterium]
MEKPERIISPDILRPDRLPPGQTPVDELPVLHEGKTPDISPLEWSLNITGMVERPMKITLKQLQFQPTVEMFADVHCVEGWSKMDTVWTGVAGRRILEITKPQPSAGFVIVHAPGDFTANLTLEDFSREDVVFAWQYGAQALDPEHGGPLRLVVPHLYFWKSVKWVSGIEFCSEDRPGFWEKAGYHNHGDPWLEERFSPEKARQQASSDKP